MVIEVYLYEQQKHHIMLNTIVMNILRNTEETIKDITIKKGEKDGDTYRFYLPNNFNRTINYCEATDILCCHVGTDGMLTFLVSDTEDKHQYFVDITDLPINVIADIVEEISR